MRSLARLTSLAVLGGSLLLTLGCTPGTDPAPTDSHTYPTYLEEYLATGKCKVAVVIWREAVRPFAESYVDSNGQPTEACPSPDVTIVIASDQEEGTGSIWQGRIVIFYNYPAGPDISSSLDTADPSPSLGT